MKWTHEWKKYAALIIKKGVDLQRGQPLLLICPIELRPLAHEVAHCAYENGASEVITIWGDDVLTRMHFDYAPLSSFETFPPYLVERQKYWFDKGAALVAIVGEDPHLLNGCDEEKLQTNARVRAKAMQPIRHYTMNDENAWCIVGGATTGWAKSVFPDFSEEEAVDALWEKIFDATRVSSDDPIAAWENHVHTMDRHASFLNEKQFSEFHYTNALGTDLTIRLPKNHRFLSAGSRSKHNNLFIANMPTEEVFTAPDKYGVNGVVYSSKPLNLNGNLVDGMRFTFENGKVVDYDAAVGKEHLDNLFSIDENGKYLGEVALVPHKSPISEMNLIFNNTLFDENASCHLAFGKAYPTCVEGGTEMSAEELEKNGINDALIHDDFMIGTSDLKIIAKSDSGEEFTLFDNGQFTF